MPKLGLCRRIAYYLADNPTPAPTLGDLMEALGARTGTAMGERVREARARYGFEILCVVVNRDGKKRPVYWMPEAAQQAVRESGGYKAWKSSQRSVA